MNREQGEHFFDRLGPAHGLEGRQQCGLRLIGCFRLLGDPVKEGPMGARGGDGVREAQRVPVAPAVPPPILDDLVGELVRGL
ncbi:hypothetical protein D3C86_1978030 [compost metagenome]